MRYIRYYSVREWKNFDKDIIISVCQECSFETGDKEKTYEHFDSTAHGFMWETKNMQEIMCKKYNITLTDFQTKEQKISQLEKQFIPLVGEAKRKSKERKIQITKQVFHTMGEIGKGTLQLIDAFSTKPAPKKRRKRRR